MSLDARVEKTSASWRLIDGSERDLKDFKVLQHLIDGSNIYPENEPPPDIVGKGMILRQANNPVGYILFEVDEYQEKRILNIEMLYVLEKQRSPLIMLQLLDVLRKYAIQQNVSHIHWTAGSDKIEDASKNAPSVGKGIYLIPIEQFNLDGLLGRL